MTKPVSSLNKGDCLLTFCGAKFFSHFSEPRVLTNQNGFTWDAITMNFADGYMETADYRGVIEIIAPHNSLVEKLTKL